MLSRHDSHYFSHKAHCPKPIPETDRQTVRAGNLSNICILLTVFHNLFSPIFLVFCFFFRILWLLFRKTSRNLPITLNAADSLSGTMRF